MLERAHVAGVTRIINPGTDLERSRAALALAETYPVLVAAVGVHPNSTANFVEPMVDELREMAVHPKVVAIGEIGLDYHWDTSPKDVQRRAFEAQLALASELELPVIVHNRESSDDVLAILTAWTATLPDSLKARPGVLHSFSASQEIADRALEIGFFLGFTGPVTFKKADDLRRIAARMPADRILIETDGPFLTPHPYRGTFPNEPAYVRFIAERLASLRLMTDEEFAALSTANAGRLFALTEV